MTGYVGKMFGVEVYEASVEEVEALLERGPRPIINPAEAMVLVQPGRWAASPQTWELLRRLPTP